MMQEPPPLVVMLEDDRDRLTRFTAMLSKHPSGIRLLYWRNAYDFISNYAKLPSTPGLIALDHDLFVDNPNDPDPGDGRDVSAFLASQKPTSPILIHSSNSVAADSMLFALRDSGWNAERISPIGDDWIEADRFPTAVEMMALK
jgi:hypothetical protein